MHDVQVGINGLAYTPNITTAAVGDAITFHFYPGGPGGHNVVQGSFDSPCTFLNGGFYSGFIITLTGESDNVFTITINDTNPIWIYCSEWMHCQLGMAMVINPPASGDNLDGYVTAAAKTTFNSTTPPVVAGGIISTQSNLSSATTTSASTTSGSSTASVSPTQGKSEGVILGGSQVVLSGIGAVVALAAFGAGLV